MFTSHHKAYRHQEQGSALVFPSFEVQSGKKHVKIEGRDFMQSMEKGESHERSKER